MSEYPRNAPPVIRIVTSDAEGIVLASTLSDAAGRYLLCSFPPGSGADQVSLVRARKPGYQEGTVMAWDVGGAVGDIELIPQQSPSND